MPRGQGEGMSVDRSARSALLRQIVHEHGGVVHTSQLYAARFTTHDVARAVALGAVDRVRRSWIALPECDEGLRRAASVSGRVTCITAAAVAGAWVPPGWQGAVPHIALSHSASRFEPRGLVLHWAASPVPVARTALSDPLVNALFHIARCLPQRDALAVWESALRLRLVEPALLARVNWRCRAAEELARVADVLSDSGIETEFVRGIRALGLAVRQQVRIGDHRVDALIGERLVVQLDGFAHHRAADRRRDLRHDTWLVLQGYTVLRFDYQQVLFDWDHVESTVSLAVAQGLSLPPPRAKRPG